MELVLTVYYNETSSNTIVTIWPTKNDLPININSSSYTIIDNTYNIISYNIENDILNHINKTFVTMHIQTNFDLNK